MAPGDDRPRSKSRRRAGGLAAGLPAGAPRQVRIVGGHWRRTVVPVPAVVGLRPTPDRVRETLYNWLSNDIRGAVVLDLFAGTGALGLEAASRGAAAITLVESDAAAWKALLAIRDRLQAGQLEIVRADAWHWLAEARRLGRRFDLVLLDPPFGEGWIGRLLPAVAAVLSPGGWVYVESEQALQATAATAATAATSATAATAATAATTLPGPSSVPDGWRVARAGRAGRVHYHLLQTGH